MSTKLETLKLYLESEGIEKETIDNLILSYYNKLYVSEFETDEGIYYVYDKRELDNLLGDLASEKFDELKDELKQLTRFGSYELSMLIEEIDKNSCIDSIKEDLDYLSFEDMEFLVEEDSYFIYKEI